MNSFFLGGIVFTNRISEFAMLDNRLPAAFNLSRTLSLLKIGGFHRASQNEALDYTDKFLVNNLCNLFQN